MKLRFLYLLAPLLLSSCTLPPPEPQQNNRSWASQQIQLNALTHWSLSGKLAIITPDERNSVNIHWQQSDQDFHINLTTFLGLSVLNIQKKNEETVITDADGKRYHSENTEQLMTQLSGMVIPIEGLQQWIKGNPNEASYQLDENQKLISLLGGNEQTGLWSINYDDYRTIKQTPLPHKLQLKRGDIRLKFAISKWEIPTKPYLP